MSQHVFREEKFVRMEEEVKSLRIKPFDGSGFNNWSFRVRAYLQQLEVLHCVETEAEEEAFWNILDSETEEVKAAKKIKRDARVKQDNKCRSMLIQTIADSHLEYVKDKNSPKKIWDALHNIFERKSITSRFLLKKQLLMMKYNESEPLQDHFLRFDRLVREMKGAGARMEEEDVICHLMITMPESYDAVTTAMEAVSDRLTMDLVRRNYLDVEAKRRGQRVETDSNEAAFSGKSSKQGKLKCFNCGGVGHKKFQCPKRGETETRGQTAPSKKITQKANVSAKTVSFVAADSTELVAVGSRIESKWYLDSGASEHMSNDRALFENLQKLDRPVVIQTAKSRSNLLARYKGRVVVQALVSEERIQVNMEDVLFIPELSLNLLSLRRLEATGKKIVFFDGCVTVEADGEIVATGRQSGRLYAMDFQCERRHTEGKALVTGKVNRELELWHHRYGHLGNDNLLKLVTKNMVDGFTVDRVKAGGAQFLCEPCIHGKQTREPFRRHPEKRAGRPLEIVHSDVCGPVTPVAWDGSSYFVTFTDDFTHVAVVYMIKTKDEVLERFMDYEAMSTAHFGVRISRLRCDNGGEYTGKAMKKFCRKRGIQLEMTVPYTPEQNGVSERLNRTIVEKSRSMLEANGVSKELWSEAVYTSAYVLNRSPSVAVGGDITPYEAWYGKKPNVSNLRVFGSNCYIHVPKQLRKKLDSKSQKVTFVGYAPNGYRVWNGKKVIVARDVIFNEDELVFRSPVESKMNEDDTVVVKEYVPKPNPNVQPVESVVPEDEDSEEDFFSEDEPAEQPEAGNDTGAGVRRSGRNVVPPKWHSDFDMDLSAFALCAENFVDGIPSDVSELKKRQDWSMWKQAIQEELESLDRNDTWSLVELPAGRKVVDSKWIFKIKRCSDGTIDKYKARLVARGFTQRQGFDFIETYSPVAKMSTVRILLALANHEGWYVHQMDVKSAFLNGMLEEEIYMRPPPGFEAGSNRVCRLNKAIYGLKQSSRNWNLRFHEFIDKLGFKRSEHDYCFYFWKSNGIVIYVLIYVDDVLIASNSLKAVQTLKKKFSAEFEMKDLQEVRNFLGLNIQRDREAGLMKIDQKAYIEAVLERFGMGNCKPSPVPMDPHLRLEKGNDPKSFTDKPYRELIGCLMYLTVTSRPDICAAVNYFAGFQCCATEEHWAHLKKVLRYLRGTADYQLVYRRVEAEPVAVFADADWGNDPNDRRSVSGLVIKLHGQTVVWSTKKQSSVALSSTEAELMALCQASCDSMWVVNLLKSVQREVKEPVTVFEDNQPCISITSDPRKLKRMKHIEVQYCFVRELIERGKLMLKYLPTDEQPADMLTKGLPAPRFRKFRDMIGVELGVAD